MVGGGSLILLLQKKIQGGKLGACTETFFFYYAGWFWGGKLENIYVAMNVTIMWSRPSDLQNDNIRADALFFTPAVS